MISYKNAALGLLIFIMYMTASNAYASCSGLLTNNGQYGYDYNTASLGVGRINIFSNYLQPVGTILATGVSNYNTFTSGALANTNDDTVILTCTAQSDKAKLGWAFATNGDSRIGGFYEIPGNPGYYATQFPYVGIKLAFADTGEVFTRIWQKSTATVVTEDTPDGGFVIKKRDIPKIIATLVKWSGAYGERKDSNGNTVTASWCSGGAETMIPTSQTSNANQVWSANYYTVNGLAAGCGQPSGYLNLLGINRDVAVGQDSNKQFSNWNYSIPIGLNGNPAATFSYTPSCVVRTTTPYVMFPTISVAQLNAGETISRSFNVTLECDNTMNKTVSTSAVAIGLQPSISAFNNAQALGLINSTTGGVSYLVSDSYNTDGIAKGVGISLKNSEGDSLNFVSWEGCIPLTSSNTSYCPAYSSLAYERSAGWDPIMSASTVISNDTVNATTSYRKDYVATLGKLPGIAVTAGKIKATASVLIRYP